VRSDKIPSYTALGQRDRGTVRCAQLRGPIERGPSTAATAKDSGTWHVVRHRLGAAPNVTGARRGPTPVQEM
jgi:hypothetical protein